MNSLPLTYLLAHYRPTVDDFQNNKEAWDEVERGILSRPCMCCGVPGHYQYALEAFIAEHGLDKMGVCLSNDGVVWDGHHRIIAVRRLGIDRIPLESRAEADSRWLHDHGPITWEDRKKGDLLPHEVKSQ